MLVAVSTQVLPVCAVCCRRLALVVKSLAKHTHPSGEETPKVSVTVAAPVVPEHLNVPAQEPPPICVIVAHAPVPVTPAAAPVAVGDEMDGVVMDGLVSVLLVSA